jgi:hypothetical protein
MLVSFDIGSLFTNVPTDLAIEVAKRRLEEDEILDEQTCLSIEEIMSLLQLCLNASYLTFRRTHYQQTFSTAMGSPVSTTLASFIMDGRN